MSSKSTMLAAWPICGGGPEVITVAERPRPRPSGGQVLIATHFAGVNRHDVNQRARGSGPAGSTDILGLEVSGVILELGLGVTNLRVGDEVCALVDGGGYAEFSVAEAGLVLPKPARFNLTQAAALPEGLFTCWLNVVELGRLQSGDWLLIHGGTSGVGSLAIQVAKSIGAKVAATAGSDVKSAACLTLGADLAINYRTQDFVAELRSATNGMGVDVILDMAGGIYAERNLQALAMDGRIVHLTAGVAPAWSAPLRMIMEKRAIVTGSLLRPLPLERKASIAQNLRANTWPLLGKSISPCVDRVLPLTQAAEAHALMETSSHIGKMLLDCRTV